MSDYSNIKTKEEFIEFCNKNGIHQDWYGFETDNSYPVTINGCQVLTARGGYTGCNDEARALQVAIEKLLKYKEKYDWEHSGETFRITSVDLELLGFSFSQLEFPKISMRNSVRDFPGDKIQSKDLIADGYELYNYDRYMDEKVYIKKGDIRDYVRKKMLEFHFQKKTDDRDIREFGIGAEFENGLYRYPVPEDMVDEISEYIFNKMPFSEDLKKRLIDRLAVNIIDEEFESLLRIKKLLENKEQIPNYYDLICQEPAYENTFFCRTRYIDRLK